MAGIAERVRAVRERIARAAERTGRSPDSVELVAVSKTKPATDVAEAAAAGLVAFGENYVQELLQKRAQIGDAVRWHFVGHLQTNKAKYLAPFCALIHSVDSLRLAVEIDRRAAQHQRRQPVLIEVKLSGEASKSGLEEGGVPELAREILGLSNLQLRGLMVMPPFSEDPEASRPYFAQLRRLRERLERAGVPEPNRRELSMGMTADYEVAIEEGATIVRVGTAIFGARTGAG